MAPLLVVVAAVCYGLALVDAAPLEDVEKDPMAGATSEVEERARQMCTDLVRWNKNARGREEALRAQLAQPAGTAPGGAGAELAERHRRELEAQRAEFDAHRRTAELREQELRLSLTSATKRAENAGARLTSSLEQAVKVAEKKAAVAAQQREQELQELLGAAARRADEAEAKLSGSLEQSVDVAQKRAAYAAAQREKELQDAVQAATKRAEEAEARAAASPGSGVENKRAAYLAAQKEKELSDSLSSATARAMSAEARLARRERDIQELEKSIKALKEGGSTGEARLPTGTPPTSMSATTTPGVAAGAGDGQEDLRASLRRATERAEAAEARLANAGAAAKEPAGAVRKREQKLQEMVKATIARAEAAEDKFAQLSREVGGLAQQREREMQGLIEAATGRATAAEARLAESQKEAGLCAGGPELSLAQGSSVATDCVIKCGGSRALPLGGSSAGSGGVLLDVIRALASWSLLLLPADPCADDPKATAMVWNPWLLICWLVAFAYLVLWRLVYVCIVWPCSLVLRGRDRSPSDTSDAVDPGISQKVAPPNGQTRTNGTPDHRGPAAHQGPAEHKQAEALPRTSRRRPSQTQSPAANKQAEALPRTSSQDGPSQTQGPTCVHFSMVDDDDDAVPLVQHFSMSGPNEDAAYADARQQLTMVTRRDTSWIAPDKFAE